MYRELPDRVPAQPRRPPTFCMRSTEVDEQAHLITPRSFGLLTHPSRRANGGSTSGRPPPRVSEVQVCAPPNPPGGTQTAPHCPPSRTTARRGASGAPGLAERGTTPIVRAKGVQKHGPFGRRRPAVRPIADVTMLCVPVLPCAWPGGLLRHVGKELVITRLAYVRFPRLARILRARPVPPPGAVADNSGPALRPPAERGALFLRGRQGRPCRTAGLAEPVAPPSLCAHTRGNLGKGWRRASAVYLLRGTMVP